MAAARRRGSRVFVAAQDASTVGFLVFSLNLKHLFSSQAPEADDDEEPVLSLPAPIACFKQEDRYDDLAIAASPSGDVIASAVTRGGTLIYNNGGAVSPGPTRRRADIYMFLVPVGDHMFFRISAYWRADDPQATVLEALQLRPGGRWGWTAVPDPQDIVRRKGKDVSAYFVSAARVYVSLERQGTYSYDTARRRWRYEGAWELPIQGRGVLVPDFLGTGRRLLFGFGSSIYNGRPLCAVDMDARPPVIIASWPEVPAIPLKVWHAGYKTSLTWPS